MNLITLDLGQVATTPATDIVSRRKSASQNLITQWPSPSGWWPVIRESFAGAWQRGIKIPVDDVMSHAISWSCVTLIANDIAKMGIKLVATDAHGISSDVQLPAYTQVLRRPNHYQNQIQFVQNWILSKLLRGNTYVLKERDARGAVDGLYILEPSRVRPMVAPNGDVYYAIEQDVLSGVTEASVIVPAREIIHDRYIALFHPLVGLSPISACAHAAMHGLKILHSTSRLFENGSQPGGVLTAPGTISQESADRIQKHWDTNFGGEANIGKVAVLGDGLKFEPMAMTAVDAQLIEQLRWGAEQICSAFHMPRYKVGVGPDPTYNNIEALNQEYYSECLQILIESLELCLNEGLNIPSPMGVECDLDALLRMDATTKMKVASDGVRGGIFTPNNARKTFNLPPLEGGDTVYLQVQNFSIAALAKRDEANPAPSTDVGAKP